MRNRAKPAVIAGGVLVSALAMLPGATSAGAEEIRVYGSDGYVSYYAGKTKLGSAQFKAYGEHLYACDTHADGDGAYAILEVNHPDGKYTETLSDPNGSKSGCGHDDLKIAEGISARLVVCIKGRDCSGFVNVRA